MKKILILLCFAITGSVAGSAANIAGEPPAPSVTYAQYEQLFRNAVDDDSTLNAAAHDDSLLWTPFDFTLNTQHIDALNRADSAFTLYGQKQYDEGIAVLEPLYAVFAQDTTREGRLFYAFALEMTGWAYAGKNVISQEEYYFQRADEVLNGVWKRDGSVIYLLAAILG